MCAVMQVFDCMAAGAHGLLRGIGKQSIGGPVNLISYYAVSLPLAIGLSFGLDWKLQGMWFGATVGLFMQVSLSHPILVKTTNMTSLVYPPLNTSTCYSPTGKSPREKPRQGTQLDNRSNFFRHTIPSTEYNGMKAKQFNGKWKTGHSNLKQTCA
jgi:hypothetical protein